LDYEILSRITWLEGFNSKVMRSIGES
jgi:hypothetical protein